MGKPTGAHVFGPLQPLARGFLFELIERGYGWTAQCHRLRLMAELSAWMATRGIEPTGLTESLIDEFLEPLRARGRKRVWFLCSQPGTAAKSPRLLCSISDVYRGKAWA